MLKIMRKVRFLNGDRSVSPDDWAANVNNED